MTALENVFSAAQQSPEVNVKGPNGLSVEIEPSLLRPIAYRVFTKRHNLILKSEALECLAKILGLKKGQNWRNTADSVLEEAAQEFKSQTSERIVSKQLLVPILANLTTLLAPQVKSNIEQKKQVDTDDNLQLVDAFDMPHFEFDVTGSAFTLRKSENQLISDHRSRLFAKRNRMLIAHNRVARHKAFKIQTFNESFTSSRNKQISSIKALLGRAGCSFIIMGILSQNQEGKLCIEDVDDKVELDMSACELGPGWISLGFTVIVDGLVNKNGTFHALILALPPAEPKKQTISSLGNLDILGLKRDEALENELLAVEKSKVDSFFVFASHVSLDEESSMEALKSMLTSYEVSEKMPDAIFLIGNFTQKSFYPATATRAYQEIFDDLARIIKMHTRLAEKCQFVLVPGALDPWVANGRPSFPKPAFPAFLASRLKKSVRNIHLASNPCRASFYTQDICISCDSYISKFQETSIFQVENTLETYSEIEETVDNDTGPARRLVRTICDQSHLCPTESTNQALYWQNDHALSLFPLPNVLILATSELRPFDIYYVDTLAINPGVLYRDQTVCWYEYWPAEKKAIRKERKQGSIN